MTDTNETTNKPPQLLSIELRILGALMEKQLTTPDQYPLTLNSLITACNQKSSREPVSNYHQGEVVRALQELQDRRLVNKEYGSRADKFSQHFIKVLELGRKHQALLCVMMLRGPQTLSELSTRTQRMADFSSKEDIEHTLDRLCNRDTPYAMSLGQQPGQRGERFAHLFSGKPSHSPSFQKEISSHKPSIQSGGSDEFSSAPSAAESSSQNNATNTEITSLKAEISVLTEEMKSVKQQIAALYHLTGNIPPTKSDE